MKLSLKRVLSVILTIVMSIALAVPAFAAQDTKNVREATVGKAFIMTAPNPDNLPVKWAISDKTVVKANAVKDNPNKVVVTPLKEGEFYISTTVGEKKYKTYYYAKNPAQKAPAATAKPSNETTPPVAVTPSAPKKDNGPFRTAFEIVEDMGVGINLGNTFDATGYDSWLSNPSLIQMETAWMPSNSIATKAKYVTTKKLIETIADAGFDSIRIPVSWAKALEDDDLTIRKDWMKRVRQVVDWALDEGMYVIINVHHDNGDYDGWETRSNYISLEDSQMALSQKRFASLWKQISAEFKDYGDKLIFEGINEPREVGIPQEWTTGTSAGVKNLNTLLALFVKTVRESGGNNAYRALMVTEYAGNPDNFSTLKLPDDDNLIISFHKYAPYHFALEPGGGGSWSASNSADTAEINAALNSAYNKYVSKGIPAIVGEYGALNTDNSTVADRVAYYDYYLKYAESKGIPCFLWETSTFIDRSTCKWLFPDELETLQKYMD